MTWSAWMTEKRLFLNQDAIGTGQRRVRPTNGSSSRSSRRTCATSPPRLSASSTAGSSRSYRQRSRSRSWCGWGNGPKKSQSSCTCRRARSRSTGTIFGPSSASPAGPSPSCPIFERWLRIRSARRAAGRVAAAEGRRSPLVSGALAREWFSCDVLERSRQALRTACALTMRKANVTIDPTIASTVWPTIGSNARMKDLVLRGLRSFLVHPEGIRTRGDLRVMYPEGWSREPHERRCR